MSHQIFERNWHQPVLPAGMLVSVSFFSLTQILMREMPFSRQAGKHSALCERLASPVALNAAVTFSNVNSLRAGAVPPGECLDTQPFLVSEIKQDHPLNLSISLSGGKEIN